MYQSGRDKKPKNDRLWSLSRHRCTQQKSCDNLPGM